MTTHSVDDRVLNTSPVDDRETPDQHTQADDLVERLLGYSSMNDHLSWRSKCEREAAAYIKELKAEVERLRSTDLSNKGRLVWAKRLVKTVARAEAAEARAAKAEEALRKIAAFQRKEPQGSAQDREYDKGWNLAGEYAAKIAREALGEEKA